MRIDSWLRFLSWVVPREPHAERRRNPQALPRCPRRCVKPPAPVGIPARRVREGPDLRLRDSAGIRPASPEGAELVAGATQAPQPPTVNRASTLGPRLGGCALPRSPTSRSPPGGSRVQAHSLFDADVRLGRRRIAPTSSSAWPPPSGCSAGSASARAWPGTSPPATPSCPTTSGSTRSAIDFRLIRASDLILVNHDGEVVEGDWPVNAAAFAIHSQVHAARPDVIAAAHAHSVYGKAFSSPRAQLLDPAHPGRLRVLRGPRAVRRLHRRRARPRGGQAHRPRPRRQQGRHPAQPRPAHRRPHRRRGGLVVHHHGAHAARPSCWPGRRHAGAHRPTRWPRSPQTQVGSHLAGWFSFQPLYDWIVRAQPDLARLTRSSPALDLT